ncbi:MAG: serine protease [Burkholderiales bacterium]
MPRSLRFFLLAFALACPAPAVAQDRAQALFETAKAKVVKIGVVLNATRSQASVGSGFLVSDDGLVVTNFHVISGYLHRPEQFTIEYTRHDGSRGPLRLINVDVVHDLALLRMDGSGLPHFELLGRTMVKGERGFSIGNPHDLGLTIVEGTYNGTITESLYEHIHFTGAINPGMSGGPALAREGAVFGVNVARLVNAQLVSFLVPAKFVAALVADARDESATPQALLERARHQLVEAQDQYLGRLLDAALPQTGFGPYRVADRLGPFMRCWGRAEDEPKRPYLVSQQNCSSEASIFVFEDVRTGSIDFEHVLVQSRGLGWLRFYKLYESRFGYAGGLPGGEEDFTEFRCTTDFVRHDELNLRTVLCVRAYKRLTGLYDFWLRAASLDAYDRGLQTTLVLTGASWENGTRFARRYLETVGKAP